MKRQSLSLALALALTLTLLTGCGGSGSSTASAGTAPGEPMDMAAENYGGGMGFAETEFAYKAEAGEAAREAKRIRTAQISLETTDFDAAHGQLETLVADVGGWFQESSVSERGSGYRYGNYVIRVPAEQLDGFLTSVGTLCHVTWQSQQTEDVSEYYYDTAGRLKTQQVKLERLQALLAKAETMEDILTVESAISETEAAIESLSGELQHYDSRIDYATVTIDLCEVYRLSNVEEPVTTLPGRLGEAFSGGWRNFTQAVESLAVWLAYHWVAMLVIAAAAVIAVPRLRRRIGARRRKTPDDKQP